MEDKIAYDLYRHFYLAYLWFLRHMGKHDIYFDEDDKTEILEHHLDEVEKIFDIIEQSMPTKIVQENRKQMAAQLGLTEDEAKTWVDNEPNFTKRIVTPLDRNKRQTRRYQNPWHLV